MPARARWTRIASAPERWTRRKLQVLLGIAALIVCALVAGAAVSVAAMLRGDSPGSPPAAGFDGPLRSSSEDELARASLPAAALEDAQPGPVSSATTGTITLPTAHALGPVDVPTGYPHTPAGALAQLISIDRAAIEPAQVARAQEVIGGWAAPGGPSPESWSGVAAVAALLTSAGAPATGATDMRIRMEASMGFIKGTVGADFVVPCVDFVVTASTDRGSTEVAVADCQRMVWSEGRWMIGPGAEPAPAPSLWPGSQASIDAGYQWLDVP